MIMPEHEQKICKGQALPFTYRNVFLVIVLNDVFFTVF